MNQNTIEQTAPAQSTWERIMDAWMLIRVGCHFVPVLTSLAWLITYCTNPSDGVFTFLLAPLIVIGLLAAVIATPWQFIKAAFKLMITGWKLGWTLCPFFPTCIGTAFLGAALGAIGGMALMIYVPAVITIYNFFKD